MKRLLYPVITASIVLLGGCAVVQKSSVYDGPLLVPHEGAVPGVPAEVEYADYWVRTADDPDRVILTPEQIAEFNSSNPTNGDGIFEVLNLPAEIDGIAIRESVAGNARYLLGADFYIMDNIPLEQSERERIVALMDTSAIPDVIEPEFGLMLRREQGKNWPTTVLFTREAGDIEFDATVGAALDMADPVALLHVSRDGRWVFVQNEMYTCWVPASSVVFGSIETVRQIKDTTNPVVATGHRVTVYGDPNKKAAIGSITMGSYLPLRTAGMDWCEVLVPGRGDMNELVVRRGYVRRSSDISIGFLPYTLRNVYRQCFVPYGRRYGWANMYEERDCSGLVMDVFKCFGFKLPRTSSKQILASPASLPLKDYDRQTRISLINSAPPGITLVGWPGHIMIYLGSVNETPYVIQATWGFREPVGDDTDVTHRLARVLVGDLMMDDGSTRGPRIDQITHMTILGDYIFTSGQ